MVYSVQDQLLPIPKLCFDLTRPSCLNNNRKYNNMTVAYGHPWYQVLHTDIQMRDCREVEASTRWIFIIFHTEMSRTNEEALPYCIRVQTSVELRYLGRFLNGIYPFIESDWITRKLKLIFICKLIVLILIFILLTLCTKLDFLFSQTGTMQFLYCSGVVWSALASDLFKMSLFMV